MSHVLTKGCCGMYQAMGPIAKILFIPLQPTIHPIANWYQQQISQPCWTLFGPKHNHQQVCQPAIYNAIRRTQHDPLSNDFLCLQHSVFPCQCYLKCISKFPSTSVHCIATGCVWCLGTRHALPAAIPLKNDDDRSCWSSCSSPFAVEDLGTWTTYHFHFVCGIPLFWEVDVMPSKQQIHQANPYVRQKQKQNREWLIGLPNKT